MSPVPGSKPWVSSFVGFTINADWDYNNGGIIHFFDGTLWSYCSEPAASGPNGQTYADVGFHILELAPGSQIWEALTPTLWGVLSTGASPNYPYVPEPFGGDFNSLGPMKGNLADFVMGDSTRFNGHHSGDEGDEYVYMMNDSRHGLLRLHKTDRTWERFYTLDDPAYPTDALNDNAYTASNFVLADGAIWNVHPETGINGGFSLFRQDADDLTASAVKVHTWTAGFDFGTGRYWYMVEDTTKVDVFSLIDNQYRHNNTQYTSDFDSIAVSDGWLYIWSQGLILDIRTTGTWTSNNQNNFSYNIAWMSLRRCRVERLEGYNNYEFETLYWGRSPEGFVGQGGVGSNDGTHGDATTSGVNYELTPGGPGLQNSDTNSLQLLGSGVRPAKWQDSKIRDGWLYFVNAANMEESLIDSVDEPSGYGHEFCRIDIEALVENGPIQHDPRNPTIETISNCRHPEESEDGGWGPGSDIWERHGSDGGLMGRHDLGWSFNNEGEIYFQTMNFMDDTYATQRDGFTNRIVHKLTPPELTTIDLTMTFEGVSLKGYSNVRQVPITPSSRTLELS